MLGLVNWPSMMPLGWTETKLWTLKYGSKSIQTSLISRKRPPKPYKLLKFFYQGLYDFGGRCLKIRDVCMDFEPYFKVHNLVSIHPKSIILSQMTNLNVIFHVVVSVYRLVKLWNSPQFPDELRNGQLTNRCHVDFVTYNQWTARYRSDICTPVICASPHTYH